MRVQYQKCAYGPGTPRFKRLRAHFWRTVLQVSNLPFDSEYDNIGHVVSVDLLKMTMAIIPIFTSLFKIKGGVQGNRKCLYRVKVAIKVIPYLFAEGFEKSRTVM